MDAIVLSKRDKLCDCNLCLDFWAHEEVEYVGEWRDAHRHMIAVAREKKTLKLLQREAMQDHGVFFVSRFGVFHEHTELKPGVEVFYRSGEKEVRASIEYLVELWKNSTSLSAHVLLLSDGHWVFAERCKPVGHASLTTEQVVSRYTRPPAVLVKRKSDAGSSRLSRVAPASA